MSTKLGQAVSCVANTSLSLHWQHKYLPKETPASYYETIITRPFVPQSIRIQTDMNHPVTTRVQASHEALRKNTTEYSTTHLRLAAEI
jgi:hypothetical protein